MDGNGWKSGSRLSSSSFLGSPAVQTPAGSAAVPPPSSYGEASTHEGKRDALEAALDASGQPTAKGGDGCQLGGSGETGESRQQETAPRQEERAPSPVPTDDQINGYAADLMRAELMGDDDQVDELRAKLERARSKKANPSRGGKGAPGDRLGARGQQDGDGASREPETQLLLRQTRTGVVMPARGVAVERDRQAFSNKIRRSKEKVDTHDGKDGVSGNRLRYFADDDANSDLQKMVERERLGLDDDPNQVFMKHSSKFMAKTDDDDYTMDDMFVDRIGKKQAKGKQENRDRDRAVAGHVRMQKQLDGCRFCFENVTVDKHLIISIGEKVYMSLPAKGSLADGHVRLLPVRHVCACTEMDEDVWEEIQVFQENLVKMWAAQGKDAVFMETVYSVKKQQHTMIDCIPLEQSDGELAPMFFKKAIQDLHTWDSQNKTLVDTRTKGLRKSIPKGFPYFSVSFGTDGGFAHVIEDENIFPQYFGPEIIGNIVDVPARTWLKPQKERFENQKRKVVKFCKQWADYDWTTMLDDTATT